MKKLLILLLLFCFCGVLHAYNVSGKVYQNGTTIPVPNATVWLGVYSNSTSSLIASTTGPTDSRGGYSVGWASVNYKGY